MNTDYICNYIEDNFSEKRKSHTEGVVRTARELAPRFGADVHKAEVASLFHDMFRGKDIAELNRLVDKYGLDRSRYKDNANLAHGKIAACFMRQELGIDDEDVINAVSYHTTGRAGMSPLEKTVFLADAIEPGRDYPGVEKLREIAYKDPERGCLASILGTIDHLLDKDVEIDADTLDAKEYFIGSLENKNG